MSREFLPIISASVNRKGVLDIDTVKGCALGMAAYPNGGCYGLCYAAKMATLYGYDFTKSVSRKMGESSQSELFSDYVTGTRAVSRLVCKHAGGFFRIGTMGDPCHDWELTIQVCEWLGRVKIPVVITKHWQPIPDEMLSRFRSIGAVFNTSISALDIDAEIRYRLSQCNRLRDAGIGSILRIVSCRFGETETGRRLNKIQESLFSNARILDNPLRIPLTDERVVSGDILIERIQDLRAKASVSVAYKSAYVGGCKNCPDQCGTAGATHENTRTTAGI